MPYMIVLNTRRIILITYKINIVGMPYMIVLNTRRIILITHQILTNACMHNGSVVLAKLNC